ncbi:MAG TPA: stage II sporulation protein M [Candidatus Hydrogenedentes bacterium]|nr:stage II sporulation protein M [Candidatus Hydrogenedentota bacterium]HRK34685.1 stage II sporulation protein M [Candidatus Hydrogenedentota bacterium]
MIIDLNRFMQEERPYWAELEKQVAAMENDGAYAPDLPTARRLHYLYERATADLAKLKTFASEPELTQFLESLVSRSYGHIHEVRGRPHRFSPMRWLLVTLPVTFRNHFGTFLFSTLVMFAGAAVGGGAIAFDPQSKATLLPYAHLSIDPKERVALEEKVSEFDERANQKAMGTSFYIYNNVSVSIRAMALGVFWGIGTIIVLFMNGALLGAVSIDYILAGEGTFLTAWLLPHGAFEIPAILIAGQGGIMLGRAIIGWGSRISLKGRLREITPDIVTLIFGVAIMLVWAAVIEAWFSQYHEPVMPYWVKITFGVIELAFLAWYFGFSGRRAQPEPE